MTGFFIKKAFFDGWDNLISLVVLNLGYLIVLGVLYATLEVLPLSIVGGVGLAVVALALHAIYTGMVSVHVKAFAYYIRPNFSEFRAGFFQIWRHAVLQFVVNLVLVTLALFIIPFYLSYGSLVTFVIAILMFWVAMAFAMAMMYFYPLAVHMPEDRPLKTLKKAFIIVADNLGFSLFFGLYHGVNLVFTLFFATIIPGVSGILLSRQVAMKLLMFKYDYIEKHPDTLKKNIPWEELLFDEREKVGQRTIKGMIFPWKE